MGKINWNNQPEPHESPQSGKTYMYVDEADNLLTLKDSASNIYKYATSINVQLSWLDSAKNFIDLTTSEPSSPSAGDRYINTATGTSSETSQAVTENYVYEWLGGSWFETNPVDGDAIITKESSPMNAYVYDTSSWIDFINVAVPSQTGNANKYLKTNGTSASWDDVIPNYDNVLIVAKSGGQYSSIQSAIDSITDASPTNVYIVLVHAGTYIENITMKNYVNVVGAGGRRAVKLYNTSGTLVTLASIESHVDWIDLEMEPTSSSDTLIDATAGGGVTGFYRIEHSDIKMTFSGDIRPTIIDANAGVGIYFISDTVTYTSTSTSVTGSHNPINLQSTNNIFYFLRSIASGTIGANSGNLSLINDDSTGRILLEIATVEASATSASFSGTCTPISVYKTPSAGNVKQYNNAVLTCTGNGSGDGYAIYFDSTTNDGDINSSRNLITVSNFANNYRYFIGTGDTVYSYFNKINSSVTDVVNGTIKEADINVNGDIIIKGGNIDFDDGSLTLQYGTNINEFSTDGTLAGNSDNAVPTEQAVRTYGLNTFTRPGATVKEIWTLSDFNPSGGIITLSEGHYQIKDTIDIGVNRFVFAAGDPFVLMEFDDSFNNYIYHTGSSMTLFSGNGALRLLHGRGNAFVIDGNNVKFMDITGSFGALYSFIGFYGTGGTLGDIRGKVVNETATAGIIMRETICDGWEDGITVNNAVETNIWDTSGEASASATGSFLTVKGTGKLIFVRAAQMTIPSGASLFNIDPTVQIPASINNYYLFGGADFFKPSTKSGSFTAIADASISATNITSVTDSSGVARFNFAAGPTVYVNQEVVVSGFTTNTDYNGTWVITSTNGTSWFEVSIIDYGSNETGSFLSNSVTLTETTTTAANGDSILVDTDNSTAYDIGSYVYNKQTNSFQINATWTATATGSWRDGSQTEREKYVNVRDCGEQTDSKNLGAVYVTGNTNTTSATADTWVDLDFGTALESAATSRFKLINTTTGEVEYTGLNPICSVFDASISAFKSGGTGVTHQFRVFKSLGTPAFETIFAENTLADTLKNIFLTSPVGLEPGDRFKIQIKAIGTSTTVTGQNISFSVK